MVAQWRCIHPISGTPGLVEDKQTRLKGKNFNRGLGKGIPFLQETKWSLGIKVLSTQMDFDPIHLT